MITPRLLDVLDFSSQVAPVYRYVLFFDRYNQQPGECPKETNGEAAPTPDEEKERMEREYESSAAEFVTGE